MKFIKILIKWCFRAFFGCILFVVLTNIYLIQSTKNRILENIRDMPQKKTALVLGTSKKLVGGYTNYFFTDRIEAAAELYKSKKIKSILVSGDNRTKFYNEPKDMLEALIKKGIPKKAITLDYAGLRTWDSIVRSKKIFGQKQLIIVTQKFHAYRALFIAKFQGIDAYVFVANNRSQVYPKLLVREIFARTLAVVDLFFQKKPKHLGEQEPIK